MMEGREDVASRMMKGRREDVASRTPGGGLCPVGLFRFQNAGIPKYSAFTCWYRTDGRFVRLRLKPALGLRPLSSWQNTKGFLHSSIVTAPQDKVFRPAVSDRSWEPLDGQLAGIGPGCVVAESRNTWQSDGSVPGIRKQLAEEDCPVLEVTV